MKFKNIQTDELILGENVQIHPTSIIKGINGNAKKITIGDNCYIGQDVQIICDDFYLGDYSKIQHHTNIHGYLPCHIGHNAWVGQYTIIDSIGGMKIGNNCGIGAHSQIWSHIKFGDTLEGSRFISEKPMQIGNDVWFVGHCIVSPIIAQDKSMAMAGSVITKDMKYNEIYAGSPAISISDKIGFQFKEVSVKEKLLIMTKHLEESKLDNSYIKIVSDISEVDFQNEKVSFFNVKDRTYTKKSSEIETKFMQFLLPEKAKFIPIDLL